MVEITYQMVLSTLQTVGILVGIFYYVMTLNYTRRNQEISMRNQEEMLKTRRTTLFHQLSGHLISNPELIKYFRVLNENPVSSIDEHRELMRNDLEYYTAYVWTMMTYDLSGIYLKAGVLDTDMHNQSMPYWHLQFWNRYKEIIYENRKTLGPSYFQNVDHVMNTIIEYLDEHPELAP